MSMRTVLIGLDGATFSILDGLMRDGVMPFLREFVGSGVRGNLRTIVPALTPPAWTSLVTGCHPGRHGIFDFFRKETPHDSPFRLVTSNDVRCDTVWSIANANGLRATVLNFPVTFPPPRIDGYLVSGFTPWRHLRLGCHPTDLYDRIKTLPGFNPRELAMDMTIEEKAIEGCKQNEYEGWVELHTRRERNWFDVLERLAREDPTELVAVLFDGVDKIQHLCWRFIDPAYASDVTSEWARGVREACLAYFRQLDGLVARIVEMAGPEATVILASDHGFGPQVRTFFVNQWLAEQGYLAWVDGQAPKSSETQSVGIGQLARHVYQLDWDRTRVYAPLPSGNGIHIVRADAKHPNGVPADEYESFRSRLMRDLLTVTEPTTGERVVSQVWRREDLFAGPDLELAPDVTVELTDGGLVSILASDSPVVAKREAIGTHRPEGVFMARGPALQRGARLTEVSILDVAPLILYSLDLPIPADLDGQLPIGALEPESLRLRPARGGGASRSPVAAATLPQTGMDEEAEMEILKRLQALGYVE
jgi:predicted AlkP superfamily phosphohydrolase/phosphomutase